MTKENATAYPNFYYARHINAGLVGYQEGVLFVNDEVLKEMMPSFVGKPVVVLHQDIGLENLEKKDGIVIESFYNEVDGRFWVKFLVETDEARKAIESGWSVSNCYQPTRYGEAGTHNNVPYQQSMLGGVYQHLAIVPNPRYEEAKIFTPEEFRLYNDEKKAKLVQLQNAKEDKKMFKVFKMKKEEVSPLDPEAMVTLENGQDVSIGEMIQTVSNSKKNETKCNVDEEVDVDGEKMPIRELINRYQQMNKKNKKNEDEEDEKKEKASPSEAAPNANEDDEDEDKSKKENSVDDEALEKARKHYYNLMNAHGNVHVEKIETTSDKLARGKKYYG